MHLSITQLRTTPALNKMLYTPQA